MTRRLAGSILMAFLAACAYGLFGWIGNAISRAVDNLVKEND